MADVDPAARTRHAADAVDRALTIAPVLERDLELGSALRLRLDLADVGDEALDLEDLGDVLLHARRGDERLVVARDRGVADAREHVGDRIGHHGITSSP